MMQIGNIAHLILLRREAEVRLIILVFMEVKKWQLKIM